MHEVIYGRVSAFVDDAMDYPAHRKELMEKMRELNALIYAVETGSTEPWQ